MFKGDCQVSPIVTGTAAVSAGGS